MKEARYHKYRLANHVLHPETLMLGYGYDPLLSEGAVKMRLLRALERLRALLNDLGEDTP